MRSSEAFISLEPFFVRLLGTVEHFISCTNTKPTYLEVILQTDKEWEGNGLKNAFFVQCVLNLLQFDNLKVEKPPRKKVKS